MISKKISGYVYDNSTLDVLSGVKIKLINKTPNHQSPKDDVIVFTNSKGEYNITFKYDKDYSLNNESLLIQYSSEGYVNKDIIPLNGDNTVKSTLKIDLQPIKSSVEDDIIFSSTMPEIDIIALSKPRKDASYFAQKRLSDKINDIKSSLIPIVLKLLYQYGITDIESLLKKSPTELDDYIKSLNTCPPLSVIQNTIVSKNKLVKKLNNLMKIVDSTTKILGINDELLKSLDIAITILVNLPVPVAVAGVGVPMSVINLVQQSIKKIKNQIDKISSVTESSLLIVVLLKKYISQLIQLLNILDLVIQHCYQELESNGNNGGEQLISQETISQTLINTTNNINIENPSTTQTPDSINGFIFSVETEVSTKTLKRRRALAKNKSGVVLLSGEWSFSSIDQILIDELIFYIQTNNLKAD